MAPQKAEMTPKLQVEALLFSSGRTMSEEQLAALTKLDQRIINRALQTLQNDYATRDSAISIFNDATGWKMMVRELYVSVVKNIVADTELSRACMETLAIIAYKYPKVLQSEIIEIRGSGAYDHMAELERLGFIRRDPEGRSYAVKLTEKFFSYFDVADGKDIRKVFKNVKVPARVVNDSQKTLGDLQIVDVKKDHSDKPGQGHGKTIGELNVVDVPQVTELPIEQQASPEQENGEKQADDAPTPNEQNDAFLSDLDERIANIQRRNDNTEKDEQLKRRQLPGAEEVSGTTEAEHNSDGNKKTQ